jgi:hypothetical protein
MNDTPDSDPLTVRLIARHAVPPFVLPSAAFDALDPLARAARVASFAASPCGAEESTVLAVWLDATMNDPGAQADRADLLRGCPDFFAGGGRALLAWLHDSGGFMVEGGARLTPVPSAN